MTASRSGAKLSPSIEQREVVAAYKVLSHVNDGVVQRCFSMVVGSLLGYISCQLNNFDFIAVVVETFPKATIKNLMVIAIIVII